MIIIKLLLSLAITSISSATTGLPQINFNLLGQVAVIGDFAGLSFSNPTASNTTNTTTTPNPFQPNRSTLISRSTNSTLILLAQSNINGTINSICQSKDGQVYVGGLFTEFGGVITRNIVKYDETLQTFSSLAGGLDGQVNTISCNTSTIYVGGIFNTPIGSTSPSAYSGNVASWSTNSSTWSPLPFAGLNGPVSTITPSTNGQSLYFGGSFSTSYSNSTNSTTPVSNSTTFPSLGSSLTPLSLKTSELVAAPLSPIPGCSQPYTIFCPSDVDGPGSSWLLPDQASGSFITRLFRPLNVGGLRLGNTFFEGRGTANFTFIAIPNNTIFELTYRSNASDPNSPLATCSNNCPLAHDPAVPYQDFLFPPNTTMTGFQLDIFGFYGAGAGLHLLQLLSDGAYAYAVDADNGQPCTAGLGATTLSNVSTTGTWDPSISWALFPGTTQDILVAPITGGSSVATAPTLTWTPFVIEDGIYSIVLTTPGCTCISDCPQRTIVDYTIQLNNLAVPTIVRFNQNSTDDITSLIYTGPLLASNSPNGGLSVTVSLAQGGAPVSGTQYRIVAEKISLVAASSNGSSLTTTIERGRGLFEYNLASTTAINATAVMNITTASLVDLISTDLSSNSRINSIVTAPFRLFIAGRFNYTRGSISSINFLSVANSTILPSPNGGLNGNITSLVESNGVVYASGLFTATTDGAVTRLNGVAQWNYTASSSSWQSLGSLPFSSNSLSDLGIASNGTTPQLLALGDGLDIYSPVTGTWNAVASSMVVGNITAFGSAHSLTNSTGVSYLAGNIIAISTTTTPGGAILTSASSGQPELSSFGFQFQPPSSSSSTTSNATSSTAITTRSRSLRAVVHDLVSNVFPTPPTPQPRSIMLARQQSTVAPVTTLPTSISMSSSSQILAGAFWTRGALSLMILGGNFLTTSGIRNIGIYDAVTTSLKGLGGLTLDGTVTALNIPGNTAWIGGDFVTGTGRRGLTTYHLANLTIDESQPALQGYPGTNLSVNVISQRPGFDNIIIVAGVFASAGTLPCASICQWDSTALRWSSLSTGLSGIVGAVSFAGTNSQFLIAAGSFAINGTTTYAASYDFSARSWSLFGNASALPGPATAISSNNGDESKIFAAGISTVSNGPYLMYYNGTMWFDINNNTLATGSDVQQLVFVPISSSSPIRSSSNSLIESDRMLLVSGDLIINSTRVSSALFDGTTWYPYLVAQTATGTPGVISSLFYSVMNFNLCAARRMAVGIVIVISMAIALGVVFFLVFFGLLFALARRRREESEKSSNVSAEDDTDPLTEKKKRPALVLAAVGAATAIIMDGKKQSSKPSPPLDNDANLNQVGDETMTSFEGLQDDDEDAFDPDNADFDSAARVRYSFTGEHPGELTVGSGEDLVVLEASDPNWWLVVNSSGAKGLIPASYLA